MPKNNKQRSRKRGDATDALLVASHHGSARGDYLFDAADLNRRPQSMLLTQRPPKHIQDMIYWVQKAINLTVAVNTAGSVAELGIAPTLSLFSESASFVALYDQFCIYSMFSAAKLEIPNTPVVDGASYGRIYSAVDFDSSTATGSEAAILEFSTVQGSELVPGKSYERFCKPCISVVTGGSNSSSATGVAMTRSWINTIFTTTPHFGIRYLTVGNNTGASAVVHITLAVILGFRNSI